MFYFRFKLLYYCLNAMQYRQVLTLVLKMSILGDSFMFCGKWFQSKGTESFNEQAVKGLCLTLGIARVVPLLFDLMLSCFGWLIFIKSLRYCGACPPMHLYVMVSILYSIPCCIGSQ